MTAALNLDAPPSATDGRPVRKLGLRKFDMSKVRDDSVVIMLGKRNTGKSFLIRDLLYHKREFPIGTVISGTEGANSFYSKHVPSLFIHEEFNSNILANVLKRQQLLTKHIAKEVEVKGRSDLDRRTFVLMDDCLYDNKWVSDKYVRSLFMNGRHYGLLYIIALQYVMGIPPQLRANVDLVFILRENNVQNRRRIFEQYAGVFPDFESFCQVMDQCTNDYELLVIDNTCRSNRIEDMVFWYKAAPHPDFRIGAREYWLRSEELDRQREVAEAAAEAATGGGGGSRGGGMDAGLTASRKPNVPVIQVNKQY